MTKEKEIPSDKSCTSLPQAWHKPRGDKITLEPAMKVTFAKASTDKQQRKRDPVFCRLYDVRSKRARAHDVSKLNSLHQCIKERSKTIPFSYILEDKSFKMRDTIYGNVPDGSVLSYQLQDYKSTSLIYTTNVPDPLPPNLDEILEFPKLPAKEGTPKMTTVLTDDINQLMQRINLQIEKCYEIESFTVDQRNNTQWFDYRSLRLTSSKFGDVLNRKSKPTEAFVKNLFTARDISVVESVQHGLVKQKIAKKQYTKKMRKQAGHSVTVLECGLVVNPSFPYLGASPDGKVMEPNSNDKYGLLEIKCPYKYRNHI